MMTISNMMKYNTPTKPSSSLKRIKLLVYLFGFSSFFGNFSNKPSTLLLSAFVIRMELTITGTKTPNNNVWYSTKSLILSRKLRFRKRVSLNMVVTPVGPFCPFRSSAAVEVEPKMEDIQNLGPELAIEMTKLNLDMQMGILPDSENMLATAEKLETAVTLWEQLLKRLSSSKDFQTKEYAKLTQVHLESNGGMSVDTVVSMMRWQAACMKAQATNQPPPMPPSNIDLNQFLQQAQQQQQQSGGQGSGMSSLSAMASAEKITAPPFTDSDKALNLSPTIRDEYDKLCRDHQYLIDYGTKYNDFDPSGKILYIDEITKIQDRWDIFFARFQLLGYLNKEYIKQCNNFLATMNMTEEQYRTLLKQCHDKMRQEAELERTQQFLSSTRS